MAITFSPSNSPDEYQLRLMNDSAGGTVVFKIETIDEDGDAVEIDGGTETVDTDEAVEVTITTRNPKIKVTVTTDGGGDGSAVVKCKAYSTLPGHQELTGRISSGGIPADLELSNTDYGTARTAA